jgi:hypothetical protein
MGTTGTTEQLQAGTMPPVGAPRPYRATYDAELNSIEQALGADAKPIAAAIVAHSGKLQGLPPE